MNSATGEPITSGDNLKIEVIQNGAAVIQAGSSLTMNSKLTVKVSVMNVAIDLPADIFGTAMSLDDIRNALSDFEVSVVVKDAAGNDSMDTVDLYVEEIWYDNQKITSGTLPAGAVITVIARSGMQRIPADFDPVGMLSIDVKSTLNDLGFQVVEEFEASADMDAGRVIAIEYNGETLSSGQLIAKSATIVIRIAG